MSLADKPAWEDAPAWANFRAMDADGSWWWFEKEPRSDDNIWHCNRKGDRFECAYAVPDENWQATLEDRPPAEQPEPDVNGA